MHALKQMNFLFFIFGQNLIIKSLKKQCRGELKVVIKPQGRKEKRPTWLSERKRGTTGPTKKEIEALSLSPQYHKPHNKSHPKPDQVQYCQDVLIRGEIKTSTFSSQKGTNRKLLSGNKKVVKEKEVKIDRLLTGLKYVQVYLHRFNFRNQ